MKELILKLSDIEEINFTTIINEVIVIDYKTGSVKTEHEKQITEYADALRKMGKRLRK